MSQKKASMETFTKYMVIMLALADCNEATSPREGAMIQSTQVELCRESNMEAVMDI